ncbi:MAG: methyltransferase domain-containing protein [Thermoplasmata archaeon]
MPPSKEKVRKLDIGCGNKKVEGAIGLDIVSLPGVDVVHDLNSFPYPFEDSSFDEIYCYDVLEHLDDLLKTMEELHRIGANGCKIFIKVPYALCTDSFTDPTHKRYFTIHSFDYFTEKGHRFSEFNFYSKARFRILKAEKVYAENRIIKSLPTRIKDILSNHIFNICWALNFELEVVK